MVQFEYVTMAKSLDVFTVSGDLLKILILTIIIYGVVDYDAVYIRILICRKYTGLQILSVNLTQLELESTRNYR